MSEAPQKQREKRGARVKLGGSVLALLQLQNRRQIRARLNQLSANGGLLQLEMPIDEGVMVEILFHVGTTTVRNKVEMLFPCGLPRDACSPFASKTLQRNCVEAWKKIFTRC